MIDDSGALFVNEFELPRLTDADPSGWPDFACYTAHALLIIELKTEPGSHRPGQLAHYDRLALATTTPASRASPCTHSAATRERRVRPRAVYDPVPTTHLQLSDLCPPITTIWAGAPGDEQRMADYLVDFLVALDARSVVLVLAGRFNGCAGPVVLGVADQQPAG